MVPLLIPVEDLPVEPDRPALRGLADLHAAVTDAEGAGLHLAMCLERPGPATSTPDDAAWSAAVESVVRVRAGLDCSLHVGDGRTAVPLLPRLGWPAP